MLYEFSVLFKLEMIEINKSIHMPRTLLSTLLEENGSLNGYRLMLPLLFLLIMGTLNIKSIY